MTAENYLVLAVLMVVSCVLGFLANRYYKPMVETDVQLAARQGAEASRLHLEHQALAEHHDALAAMYAERVRRLHDYGVPYDVEPPKEPE